MISLHEVHEQGGETVKAAVLAFGARHGDASGPVPRWEQAEKHFTYLIETIMGTAAPPQTGIAATVRWAENEAIGFLLAVNNRPDYRCPFCIERQGTPL
ncbi:hypothetical protein [Streptomyces hokutonensis]|uniref:hypothetical protein n=1 Tax=Streptomyces hokutonensis TaxID=1306990 RepID=UPI0037FF2B8B